MGPGAPAFPRSEPTREDVGGDQPLPYAQNTLKHLRAGTPATRTYGAVADAVAAAAWACCATWAINT